MHTIFSLSLTWAAAAAAAVYIAMLVNERYIPIHQGAMDFGEFANGILTVNF